MTGTRLLSEKLKIIVYKSLNIVYKNMCLLEEALKNNDVDMVIWLLRCDPRLIRTCKNKLIELNMYDYVTSKIQF